MTPATSPSPTLPVWHDDLCVHVAPVDDDHRAIVAALALVIQAGPDELMPRWAHLIALMEAHFAQEDAWLVRTGFSPDNCHSTQHATIVRIMREGEARGHAGEGAVVRQMADELGQWLPLHVHSMDASMVAHFESVGFDAAHNAFTHDRPLEFDGIQSCGGGGGCED